SFQAVQGGPNPPSQIVTVSQNSNNMVIWSSNDDATWVSLVPTMGMMTRSTQVSVSVSSAGLATGSYTATVTITTPKGKGIRLPVTLTVISGTTTSSTSTSSTNTAMLTWDAPTSSTVVSYNVFMGTASGVYGPPINVGNVLTYQ